MRCVVIRVVAWACVRCDISHSDFWVNQISAGLPQGEECIKQAEARKCFMKARAVFHHSYNKSDKRGDGNNPDWGQMITVLLQWEHQQQQHAALSAWPGLALD